MTSDAKILTIDCRGRRDETGAVKDDGEIDIFEPARGVFLGQDVRNDGSDRADKEEEGEGIVDLTL